MTHWHFIALAYGTFAVFMLWDYLLPRRRFNQGIRQLQLKMRRNAL